EDVRPHRNAVLSSLQFVTSPAGHIAGRTQWIRQGIKLRRVGEFINGIDRIVRVQTVIDPGRPLIDVKMACGSRDEILRATAVGHRIQGEKAGALFAPTVLGNPVAREWRICIQRIAHWCRDRAEISISECGRWHGGEPRFLLASALSFVSHEEKRLVFLDGPAEYTAELVSAE